jgi:uncharacterized protein YqgC (DUF456 family)
VLVYTLLLLIHGSTSSLFTCVHLSSGALRAKMIEADHMASTLPKKKTGVVAAAFSGYQVEIIMGYASRLKSFGSGRHVFSKTLLTNVSDVPRT